jgi:ABC-type antimicrobial peptide transport system permease subunit
LALLSGFFAIIAMTLAAIGLYGVLNYAVVQRTREIGIRVALGAGQGQTITLVLRNIIWIVAIGLSGGVALGLGQFLTTLLFEIKPSDFWGIALPLMCLIAVPVLASVPPAIRAARVESLRSAALGVGPDGVSAKTRRETHRAPHGAASIKRLPNKES